MQLAGKFKRYGYSSLFGDHTIILFCLENGKENPLEKLKALVIYASGMQHYNKKVPGQIHYFQATDLDMMLEIPPERIPIYTM